MPTFAVGDVPVWNTAEFPIVAASEKSGKKPAAPVPVMAAAEGATLEVPLPALSAAVLTGGAGIFRLSNLSKLNTKNR